MQKRKLVDPKDIDYNLKNLPQNSKIIVYIEVETEDGTMVTTRKKNRFTINEIGTILLDLKNDVKDIKVRVGKLEDRLDYIVKANKLKDKKK